MKTRLVRCYRGLASLPGRWNIEVFYSIPDMFAIKLFTCIECGAVYVIDFENPGLASQAVEQIARDTLCAKCDKPLRETIRPYPEFFRAEDGRIGHFEAEHIIPPDSESLVKEFLELGAVS
jgi:hypothetical protein